MRTLLAIVGLLLVLPGAAYAADILINNGFDSSLDPWETTAPSGSTKLVATLRF